MITRYALFEGSIRDGMDKAFRNAVLEELVPTWTAFPGAEAVRVSFADARDDGAPEYPLILAVDFADQAALDRALASEQRISSRAATQRVVPQYFDGRIHHHVTAAHAYLAAAAS